MLRGTVNALPAEIVLLLVILALFFVPVWLSGDVFGEFDASHITIPTEDVYARYQRAGEIPLWTPEFQGGFPLFANGIQSFLYPPHMVLRQFLPGVWVVNLSFLLHVWLAAVGMWLFLRHARLPRLAAFAGALVFAGGGYFLGRVALPHLLFPAAWMPLALWALFRFWRTPRVSSFVLLLVLLAAQFFSGHIQVMFYTGLLLAGAIAVLVARSRPLEGARRVLPLLLAPLGVFLLIAVQLLPTLELLGLSKRADALVGEEAFDVSYPPQHLLTWLSPRAFGSHDTYVGAKNEPELLAFFGLVGLLLGGVALLTRSMWKDAIGRVAIVLIVIGFLFAGGEFSPVYRALYAADTPLTWLANPGRAILLVHVGWSLLVALGVRALGSGRSRSRVRNVLGAILIVGLTALWAFQRVAPEARPLVVENLRAARDIALIVAGVGVGVLILPWLTALQRSRILVILLAAELLFAGMRINPRVPAAAWRDPPRVLQLLPDVPEAPRIYAQPRPAAGGDPPPREEAGGWAEDTSPFIVDRELLSPIFGESVGLSMTRGHLALQIARVSRHLFEMGEREDFDPKKLQDHRDLLDRMSVGTIIAGYDERRELTGLPDVESVGSIPVGQMLIRVYRNLSAYPRVGVAARVVVPEGVAAHELLVAGVPRDTVVVEDEVDVPDLGRDPSPALAVARDEPSLVEIETESDSSQFLVLRDVFTPDWTAAVDGEDARLTVTDGIFRGVVVPPGAHTVRFRFSSVSFRRGAVFSAVSWLGAAGVLARSVLGRCPTHQPGGSLRAGDSPDGPGVPSGSRSDPWGCPGRSRAPPGFPRVSVGHAWVGARRAHCERSLARPPSLRLRRTPCPLGRLRPLVSHAAPAACRSLIREHLRSGTAPGRSERSVANP